MLRRMFGDCTCAMCLKRKAEMSIDDKVGDAGKRKMEIIQRPSRDDDTKKLYRWNCSGYDLPEVGRQIGHVYFTTIENPNPKSHVSCENCSWTMKQYVDNLQSRSELKDKEKEDE